MIQEKFQDTVFRTVGRACCTHSYFFRCIFFWRNTEEAVRSGSLGELELEDKGRRHTGILELRCAYTAYLKK